MTVTPVLADQLEDAGVRRAAAALPGRVADRRGGGRHRRGAAPSAGTPARPSCARYRHALELLDADGGDPLRPFQRGGRGGADRARRLGGDARRAAAAGDPRRGCGCSSTPASARTGAASAGTAASGCPSAPTRRGSSGAWPSRGCAGSASTRARHAAIRWTRWRRSPPRPGPVALPIDWEAIQWLWSLDGYPSDPAHAQFAGKSLRGVRIWKVGGGGYDPAAAAAAARRQAGEFLAADRRAAARVRRAAAGAAACSSSRSTPSCSATGGRRGRSGCARCSPGPTPPGVRLLTVPEALAEHEPVERPLARLDLGRGEGPAHLGLAAGRRPRLGRAAAGAAAAAGARRGPARRRRRRAPRASCSRSRRATGPSSTSAARRATTPSSGPPTTPRRLWRP